MQKLCKGCVILQKRGAFTVINFFDSQNNRRCIWNFLAP
jgi:hypothetical protein